MDVITQTEIDAPPPDDDDDDDDVDTPSSSSTAPPSHDASSLSGNKSPKKARHEYEISSNLDVVGRVEVSEKSDTRMANTAAAEL